MPNEPAAAPDKSSDGTAAEIMEREFVLVGVGTVGLATYPGQSPEEVLAIARLIQWELEVDQYTARSAARKVIPEIDRLRKAETASV